MKWQIKETNMHSFCHTFGSAHSEVLLTGSYPDNGHQVKKDFGLLFSQNSTDGVTKCFQFEISLY